MVVFGTLFKGKMGGIKDLLVLLEKEGEVKEIDAEFQKRKLLGPWGLKELVKLYRGISIDKLREIALNYCQQNLLDGIREAVIALKKKGFLVGVLSSNPQFLMDTLREILPLDFALGTQLEFKEGVATGRIEKELNRHTKAEILKRKIKEYGLAKENVIFIARASVTHLPMAKESGIFIGLDPTKQAINEIARILVTSKSFRKIF